MNFKSYTALLIVISLLTLVPVTALAVDYRLDDGTALKVKILQTVSSKTSHEGDPVTMQVYQDVYDKTGKIVFIKAGTSVEGCINRIQKNGAVGKAGELGMSIDQTRAVDGQSVPLRAVLSREGESKTGSTVALGVVTGIIFLPGLFFLMRHGKDAEIPAGSIISAYTNHDAAINIPVEPQKEALK